MRARNTISWIISLVMIGAGAALMASFFLNQGSADSTATNAANPNGFNVPELGTTRKSPDSGPKDKTLKLTIPAMKRVEKAKIPNAPGSDRKALDSSTAIHLEGTGFPWQKVANVYIAGHRLGYPNTDSFLSFYDLDSLKNGDKVFIKDATGKKYTYKVFKEMIVGPTDLHVTDPVPGKNVVTLQSCTLPDYSKRLIVQAELVDKA